MSTVEFWHPLINGGAGAKSPAGARGVLARFSPPWRASGPPEEL